MVVIPSGIDNGSSAQAAVRTSVAPTAGRIAPQPATPGTAAPVDPGQGPAVASPSAVSQASPDAALRDKPARHGGEVRDDAARQWPAGAAATEATRETKYRYNIRFIQGLGRPLIELVDTQSDRRILSYPPESVVHLLENAQRLGVGAEDVAGLTVDATA